MSSARSCLSSTPTLFWHKYFCSVKVFKIQTRTSCHVLSLSVTVHGVTGCCCWSQSQLCLRARAGYSLDKSPANHRALTDEQYGFSILIKDTSTCKLSITSRPALPTELQPPDNNLFLMWNEDTQVELCGAYSPQPEFISV